MILDWTTHVTARDQHAGMWETSLMFESAVAGLVKAGMPLEEAIAMTLESLWIAGERMPRADDDNVG